VSEVDFKAACLGDIADFEMGQAPPGRECNKDGVGTVFVKTGEFGELFPKKKEWTTKPLKFGKDGDIFICVVGATCGKLNLGIDCAIGRSVAAIRPKDGVETRFVYYQLMPWVLKLRASSSGSAQGVISKKQLKEVPVVIAPLEQQKAIVAEIEKQFSRLDEAVANLKRVKANLKRYKAAVLKAAVEGKLTEEWRKQHLPAPSSVPGKFYTYAILCDDDSIYIGHTDDIERRWSEHRKGQGAEWTQKHKPVKIAHYEEYESRADAAEREKWLKTGFGRKWLKRELEAGRTRQAGDVEPADKLLERILAERREKWQGRGRYKEPAAPDTTDLPELPEGWVWANFETVSDRVSVGHVGSMKNEYVDEGVPFLRSQNVRANRFDHKGLKYVSEGFHKQLSKSALKPGDIVVVRSGSVGVSCVIPEDLLQANCSDLVIIKSPSAVLPAFGAYYMNSVVETRVAAGKVGVALIHFNTKSVAELPVPVPPIIEQREIVDEVERCLSIVSEAESEVDNNLRRAERLRQSILKQAFSGRLT